jgi:OOP family OmpA-OmpF porin
MPNDNPEEFRREDELSELKRLLFQDEIERLNKLEAHLRDHNAAAQSVSDVIAEAVVMRSSKDNMLTKALEPIVEESLKEAIRKRPQDLTNTLFPLIGSTIRRSIAETFRSMLGNFSKSLEFSFSPKGIKWRIEAMRTGKPFSEVVLLHTLVYRVDQIFLIHSETGLVLSQATNKGVDARDADMISGMLTAIQDFARDCFNKEGSNSTLNSLEMDDYTIYIERSPEAYLACVVRGSAPLSFLRKLRETLELILAKCNPFFEDFDGDATPFAVAYPYLEDCLEERFVDEEKSLPFWVKFGTAAVLAFIVLATTFAIYRNYQMTKAVDVLRREPGIIVFNVDTSGIFRPWEIFCMKDELAPDFDTLLWQNDYNPELLNINSVPFVSYDQEIVWKRYLQRLDGDIPSTVEVSLEEDKLVMVGYAEMNWILKAREAALRTDGILYIDMERLNDPRYARLKELVRSVESTVIRFPLGGDTPIAADTAKLETAVASLVELERDARDMGLSVSLTIYGHADITGYEKRNYEISQARARTIAAKLYANGSAMPVAIYGMGSDFAATSAGDDQSSRKIELRVHLAQAADVDSLLK